jgi:hypothetical protein
MKSSPHLTPEDHELEQLLARRYRETSPEFEARWVDLKRVLRQTPKSPGWHFQPWRYAGWLGGLGIAAAIVMVVQLSRPPSPHPSSATTLTPQLAELFAMDAALSPALPLLDEENRTVLLHLPAAGQPQN